MNKKLRVKCPQCALGFAYYESIFRPFCSERCKQIDLGHWFQESYKVPEKENSQSSQTEKQENEKNSEEVSEKAHEEDDYNESDYS